MGECSFNKQLLHETFPGHVLSRFDHKNWPLDRVIVTTGFIFMRLFEVKSLCRQARKHAYYEGKIQRSIEEIHGIYAKFSWKVSAKECVCARKAVEVICLICYSIHDPLLCILRYNRRINGRNLFFFQFNWNLALTFTHSLFNCLEHLLQIGKTS